MISLSDSFEQLKRKLVSLNLGGTAVGAATELVVIKSADESRSSTTLTDDADLQFSVDANSVYFIRSHLWVTKEAGAQQVAFRFSGPVDMDLQQQPVYLANNYALATGNSETTTQSLAADNYAIASNLIFARTITAGTFRLQWAQSSTDAQQVTLAKDSIIIYRKIS